MHNKDLRRVSTETERLILKPVTAVVSNPVWQHHYCIELQVEDVGEETVHTAGHTEVR